MGQLFFGSSPNNEFSHPFHRHRTHLTPIVAFNFCRHDFVEPAEQRDTLFILDQNKHPISPLSSGNGSMSRASDRYHRGGRFESCRLKTFRIFLLSFRRSPNNREL